jgi:hypothetical protein
MRKTRLTGSFQHASRALEDAFFLEQDKILVEKQRAMKKLAETKEALSTVSGITNDEVLSRLVELDIKPETVAALATIPLIEVAWADGKIDPKERKAVLAHVNARGIAPGSIEHDLLERWLIHRPEPSLLKAWQAYLRGLCERLTHEEQELLKEELLRNTTAIARAAGGFLGIGRVSKEEKEVLELLACSFPGPA